MSVKTAIVLAGGEGLRLRPLTNKLPKAMVPIQGRPLIHWILSYLSRNEITNVVIGVAYQKEKIIKYVRTGARYNLDIKYSEHTVEGGTAQGFRLAIERFIDDDVFIAMNGDELSDLNLQVLAKYHCDKKGTATVAVSPLRSPYGVVRLKGNRIIGFDEKPIVPSLLVSTGIYVFGKSVSEYLPKIGDIERTAFPKLAAERKLVSYQHNGFWISVNTVKDVSNADKRIAEMGM